MAAEESVSTSVFNHDQQIAWDRSVCRPAEGTRCTSGRPVYAVRCMTTLGWLGLAVLIAVVAAVTGIKPKGTRHVARTRLMGMARLALLAVVIIIAYVAFRART